MSVFWEPLKYVFAGVGGLAGFSLFAQLLTTDVLLDQDAMQAESAATELERGAMKQYRIGESPATALATYSKKLAWEKLEAAKSPGEKAQIAAAVFMGYWMANGRGRLEICAENGVDIGPVVEEFQRRNADLHDRATALLSDEGVSEDRLFEIHRGPIKRQIGYDMLYMFGAPMSLKDSCVRLNQEATKFLPRTDFDKVEPGIAYIIRKAPLS